MGHVRKWNEIIRHERESRNWTQTQVAHALHTDSKRVSEWEIGKTRPSYKNRKLLMKLFGKSAQDLGFLTQEPSDEVSDTLREDQVEALDTSQQEKSISSQATTGNDSNENPNIQVLIPQSIIYASSSIHITISSSPASAIVLDPPYAVSRPVLVDEYRRHSAYYQQGATLRPTAEELENTVKNRREFLGNGLRATGAAFFGAGDLLDAEIVDRFFRALQKPSTIDETTLQYLRKRTANYYRDRHDASVASYDVLSYALDHFRKATELLEEPLLPTMRIHLSSIAGEIAQLIGELHFEIGNYAKARVYHKVAIKAAQEANNQALQAIAWGWMSFAWTYSGEKQEALICVQEARRLAQGSANGTVRAWLAAVEAEIQANLDNLLACRKALEGAECVDEQSPSLEASHWIHFDRSLLGGYQGICFLRLYRLGNTERSALVLDAQHALMNALDQLDSSLMRRQPTYLADLSSTYIRQGEIGEACKSAIQAVVIAAQIKSQMVLQRLLTLRSELEPWKDIQDVKNLDEHLAPLLLSPRSRGNA